MNTWDHAAVALFTIKHSRNDQTRRDCMYSRTVWNVRSLHTLHSMWVTKQTFSCQICVLAMKYIDMGRMMHEDIRVQRSNLTLAKGKLLNTGEHEKNVHSEVSRQVLIYRTNYTRGPDEPWMYQRSKLQNDTRSSNLSARGIVGYSDEFVAVDKLILIG